VFGSIEIGSMGRNTMPSNVASMVLTMNTLALVLRSGFACILYISLSAFALLVKLPFFLPSSLQAPFFNRLPIIPPLALSVLIAKMTFLSADKSAG
jgi:hypothetical protein